MRIDHELPAIPKEGGTVETIVRSGELPNVVSTPNWAAAELERPTGCSYYILTVQASKIKTRKPRKGKVVIGCKTPQCFPQLDLLEVDIFQFGDPDLPAMPKEVEGAFGPNTPTPLAKQVAELRERVEVVEKYLGL